MSSNQINHSKIEEQATFFHRMRAVMALAVLAIGLFPLGLYWRFIGHVPTVSAEKAEQLLAENGDSVAFVDIRSAEEYHKSHLPSAYSWPLEQIYAIRNPSDLPAEIKGKKLLLLCNSGITSSWAAEKFSSIPGVDVYNVRGGLQTFGAGRELKCPASLLATSQIDSAVGLVPFRESSDFEQWTAVLTGFAVKPTYTILSFLYVILLWRATSPDLVALRWAMIAFFFGENFCAANYLICQDGSYLFEYLHSFGMLLCFSLTVFALLEGIDRRLLKYSDLSATCSALELCRRCSKYAKEPCGLQRIFLWILPALMILCFMPLTADFEINSYNTRILGTLYNYSHAVVYQIYEIRYLPFVAFVLFVVSWCILKLKRHEPVLWSKMFFAVGMGALGFSLFRMILLHAYPNKIVWFAAWEEITEFIFIFGTGITLAIFRRGLFAVKNS